MFDLPTLLARIPDEYKPLAAFCIGSMVLVGLAMFHGVGLHLIFVLQKRWQWDLLRGRPNLPLGILLFGWSVFLMLTLHIAEILIWASALTHAGFIKHPYDAIYFCANAYTTLGMGTLDVGDAWRNVSPIIGISGLFTFAWTTSALVDVVAANGRLLERLEEERREEMHMRMTLRKEEWDALKKARSDQLAERDKTKAEVGEVPFLHRHKIWESEREREAEIRRVVQATIKELREKEREAEEKLGPGGASADSRGKEQQGK